MLHALAHIRIVLVETSLSANIGSACRAMKTMGLNDLVLANPQCEVVSDVSMARASGADDLLQQCRTAPNLAEAVSDCTLVLGASARSRSFPWPLLNPRQAAEKALAVASQQQTVALVFGRERSGLTNDELAQCHAHLHIPANPDYSSLNVASAVQVLSYELRMAYLAEEVDYQWSAVREEPPASHAQMEGFFSHLEQALVDIEYLDPNNPKLLMNRLRRLYLRAEPDTTEVNILRGILKQTIKAASGKLKPK
ncbi:RNA methyltransferase [Gynuella sp.]|uniref:RNA methyltransferase n=1 Tax=Gynuella sp. TaxID=2969146 RepID=UPI003D101FA6